MRDAISNARSHIREMIQETASMIEENMRDSHRGIDFNIIEELKRRRGEKRVTGEDLEMKRDEIIFQVQKQIF